MTKTHCAIVQAATLALICSAAPALGAEAQYRSPAEVAQARAQGDIGGNIIVEPTYRVMILRRDKVGESEVHHAETDIMFVVDGRATIVVGGEMIGAHDTAPGEVRGSGIKGGKDYVLEPGMVLTIPAETPHWIRETTPGFRYNVVKVKGR